MAKRCLEKEFRLDDITEEDAHITVHSRVMDLTDVRKGHSSTASPYFAVYLGEENTVYRLACFDEEKREDYVKIKEKGMPVKLTDIHVVQSKFSTNGLVELKTSPNTKLEESDWAIKKINSGAYGCKVVPLLDAKNGQMQNLTLHVKVLKRKGIRKVETKDGRMVKREEVVIADESGCGVIVLWERNVGQLKIGQTVALNHLKTKKYEGNVSFYFTELTQLKEMEGSDEIASISGKIKSARIKRLILCEKCNGNTKETSPGIYHCADCKRALIASATIKTTIAEIEIINSSTGDEEDIEIDEQKISSLLNDPNFKQMEDEEIEDSLLKLGYFK